MTFEERIKQIKEHFKNITSEQLETNLIKAGLGEINSLSSDNMRLTEPEEDFYSYTLNLSWKIEELLEFQQFEFHEVA
jgi:hypothetical protein